jgi:hypothetical protein
MQRIIYGVFNGEHLDGEDGKHYPVPGNYASKSCLVEGDELKLTITEDCKFIYKQIKLAERKKFIARVVEEDGRIMLINEKGRLFGLLPVVISFFQLKPDDEVVAVISEDRNSHYAAVEIKLND